MKRFAAMLLAAAMALSLAACGTKDEDKNNNLQELKIGVSANGDVQRDVFGNMESRLEGKGYKLVYVEYDTAAESEKALAAGEVDFTCFSDKRSFEAYSTANPSVLLNLGAAYYYPYGIYLCNFEKLENVTKGATVAIPDDTEGMARSLMLLEAEGFIKLKEGAGMEATLDDIAQNTYELKIAPQPADTLAALLKSFEKDMVVMGSQTAVDAGYSVHKTAVAIENKSSTAAAQCSTLLLIRAASISEKKILDVKTLFFSPLMYDLIDDFANDLIVPAFDISGKSS